MSSSHKKEIGDTFTTNDSDSLSPPPYSSRQDYLQQNEARGRQSDRLTVPGMGSKILSHGIKLLRSVSRSKVPQDVAEEDVLNYLRRYDTVIILDDSGSMTNISYKKADKTPVSRWKEVSPDHSCSKER